MAEEESKFAGGDNEQETVGASSPEGEQTKGDPNRKEPSKFLASDIYKDAWGHDIDPVFEEYLKKGSRVYNNKYRGLSVVLASGHKLHWKPSVDGKSSEFIGMLGLFANKRFDEDDARAVIAGCKSHGWKSVRLQGSKKCKNLMWMEAQRQGLNVRGYVPPPSVLTMWEKEKASMATQNPPEQKKEDNVLPLSAKTAPKMTV